MNKLKGRKVSTYTDTYDYYDFYFFLKARAFLNDESRQEYQVSIYESDSVFLYRMREPILAPVLRGKTPQIAFSEAKKFIKSIYIPDPEFKELCDHHDRYMRRVEYDMNKKKKPYVPRKTKS